MSDPKDPPTAREGWEAIDRAHALCADLDAAARASSFWPRCVQCGNLAPYGVSAAGECASCPPHGAPDAE